MSFSQLDRHKIRFKSLGERKDRVYIEKDYVPPTACPGPSARTDQAVIDETVERIVHAREDGKSRMLAFGAHAIKNGLGLVLVKLIKDGWITHLATNGGGIIHDWEFAFQGRSSENVRENVARGEFGIWHETGFYVNLAIIVGAYEGRGYGESIGAFVEHEGLDIPSEEALRKRIAASLNGEPRRSASAADLLHAIRTFDLEPGWLSVPHPFKEYGLQAAAYRLGVPFTGHPMIGHDIIYTHPLNNCAAIGRAAQRDFLAFAQGVADIDGGVYLSLGSAVMSPMIFEKSLSMAQNVAIQEGRHIDGHFIVVVDLAESTWDWQKGEPPWDSPEFYVRYNKTFSRMGGTMRYLASDNRDFLLALLRCLERVPALKK